MADNKTTTAAVFQRLREIAAEAGYREFKGRFVEDRDLDKGSLLNIRMGPSGESYSSNGPITTIALDVVIEWHGPVDPRDPVMSMFAAADSIKAAFSLGGNQEDCSHPLQPVRIIGGLQLNKIAYIQNNGRTNYGIVQVGLTIKYRS